MDRERASSLAGHRRRTSVTGNPFVDRLYVDALSLLERTRDYVTDWQPREQAPLSPADRLRVIAETTRATSRLLHVMAWLLNERAIAAGELPRSASLDAAPVLDNPTCLVRADRIEGDRPLPPRLGRLLEESFRLYVRAQRLELLMRDEAGEGTIAALEGAATAPFTSIQTTGNAC